LPENNTFVRNTLTNNGTDPQPGDDPLIQALATLAADITWVVLAPPDPLNNYFSDNTCQTVGTVTPGYPPDSQNCPSS
jgi:hypothetical protein